MADITLELINLVKSILSDAGLNVPVYALAPDIRSTLPAVTIQKAGGTITEALDPEGPWWTRIDYELSVWASSNKEKYGIANVIINGIKDRNPNPTESISWIKVVNEGTDVTQREQRFIVHRLVIPLQVFYLRP